MDTKQLNFLLGALDMLPIAIGREAIAHGQDISVEQLELIKRVVADVKNTSFEFAQQ
tara:strand:+ start:1321 stop:1491 length:171 start_codon:yes stop_codon:yes gene_type:complete